MVTQNTEIASGRERTGKRKDTAYSDDSDITKVASESDQVDGNVGTSQDLVASALWNRYQEHGRLTDLEEAIRLDRESLATQEAALGKGMYNPLTAVNLGVSLFDLYNHTHAPEALDESVQLLERALVLMSESRPAELKMGGDVGVDQGQEEEEEHASLPRAKVNLGNAYRARAELRKLGVEVRTGARVAGSQEVDGEEGSGAGKKTEVLLDGGDKILTDLYLPTMGLVPNTEYLPASLLTEARFVDVDDHFAVKGAKDVWAAGDIVWKPRGSFVLADMQVSPPFPP